MATWEDTAERLEAFVTAVLNREVHMNPEFWVTEFHALAGLAGDEVEHRPAPAQTFPIGTQGAPAEVPSWAVSMQQQQRLVMEALAAFAAQQQKAAAPIEAPAAPVAAPEQPTAVDAAAGAGLPIE